MRGKYPVVGIAILAGLSALASRSQPATVLTVGKHIRSAVFAEGFMGVDARFENGYRPEHRLNQTQVRLYDSSGRLVRTNEVEAPGAEVRVVDMSVNKRGATAVVAFAVSGDGAMAGLLLLFDRQGPPRFMVRTNPFLPALVAITPEGEIWIGGIDQLVLNTRALAETKVEDLWILQKYDANGHFVRNYLRASSDRRFLPWTATSAGGMACLRASASSVGLYSPHEDGSGEWNELTFSGEIQGRWQAPPPSKDVGVHALSLTDSGSVYADWRGFHSAPASGTYRLNKTTNAWDRVENPEPRPVMGLRPTSGWGSQFIGTDGNFLVFDTSRSPRLVLWFEEPTRKELR